MKKFPLVLILILLGCGGTLSDEQRKKIRENMAQGEIRKVTDAELTAAAFDLGRQIAAKAEDADKTYSSPELISDLEKDFQVDITLLDPGDAALKEMEKQVVDAYAFGNGENLPDNVQKLSGDSLLYTKPVMQQASDGSLHFVKAIGIRLSKKQLILSMNKK